MEHLEARSPPLCAAGERRTQSNYGHHQHEYQYGEGDRGREHHRRRRSAQ
jgi:hypothetical protein